MFVFHGLFLAYSGSLQVCKDKETMIVDNYLYTSVNYQASQDCALVDGLATGSRAKKLYRFLPKAIFGAGSKLI